MAASWWTCVNRTTIDVRAVAAAQAGPANSTLDRIRTLWTSSETGTQRGQPTMPSPSPPLQRRIAAATPTRRSRTENIVRPPSTSGSAQGLPARAEARGRRNLRSLRYVACDLVDVVSQHVLRVSEINSRTISRGRRGVPLSVRQPRVRAAAGVDSWFSGRSRKRDVPGGSGWLMGSSRWPERPGAGRRPSLDASTTSTSVMHIPPIGRLCSGRCPAEIPETACDGRRRANDLRPTGTRPAETSHRPF